MTMIHMISKTSPVILLLILCCGVQAADEKPPLPVGMPGHMEGVVLPAPELEVRPLTDSRAPLVLRIENVQPHGTAFRYDFVYYALEPGTYDLMRYLQPKNHAQLAKLPPLNVETKGLLPPGLVRPHAPEARALSWFMSYRALLVGGAVIWLLGLLLLIFWRRGPHARATVRAERPVTAAERLGPLVAAALAGTLPAAKVAELERTLLAFWRERLAIGSEKPALALARLRQDPQASALLEQLEVWLHAPGTAGQVDLAELLRPYREALAEKAVSSHSGSPA